MKPIAAAQNRASRIVCTLNRGRRRPTANCSVGCGSCARLLMITRRVYDRKRIQASRVEQNIAANLLIGTFSTVKKLWRRCHKCINKSHEKDKYSVENSFFVNVTLRNPSNQSGTSASPLSPMGADVSADVVIKMRSVRV
ncbi:hypothetical protein EVAR_20714_1 [Eumeta japonica]|uniref:Uncharacterized protein n=1 Tax=Eumeta variegata TaxID=151549 RepID=A0A4C1V924_EUMVA|nr:hypothetical protein EVAR_20714_1 [Eumeta japonica]